MYVKLRTIYVLFSLSIMVFFPCHIAQGAEPQADSIKAIISEASSLMYEDSDSAQVLLEKAYLLSIEQKNDSLQMMVYYQFSRLFESGRNHYLTIDYALKALDIIENISLADMHSKQLCYLIELNSKIGYSYFYLNMKDLARKYIKRVVQVVDTIKSINATVCSDQIVAYSLNNLSGIYLDLGDLDAGYDVVKRVEEINMNLKDTLLKIALNINKGIYYKEKGFFDSAMIAYNKALAFSDQVPHKPMLTRIHNNLAILQQQQGNNDDAKSHFSLAMNLAREASSWSSLSIAAKGLSEIYAESGDYKRAYENSAILVQLNDSIFNPAKNEQFTQMALQYDFDKEMRQHQTNLTAKWKEQHNQKQAYRFLAVILLLVVVIVVIILVSQRRKTKLIQLENDYATLRTKKLEHDKQAIEDELEVQKRHLMEKVMWLVRNNEMVDSLASQLTEVKNSIPQKYSEPIVDAIKLLNDHGGDNFQKEFEIRFGDVNREFLNTLNEKYPDLSPAEMKLASFLSLNLSTKEIAAITYQNPDSLKVARSRLRTKLGLEKGQNLVNFLINLR